MRIDLHVHTSALSFDSNVAPDELVELARRRGLDGLVLTEHDRLWPAEDIALLTRLTGFLVLPGVELTTDAGHVLVFGLPELPTGVATARTLRAICDEAGALMFLAHPARNGAVRVPPEELAGLFDGVEGINGSDGALQNQASARAGRGLRLPAIAGSDTHARHEVGLAATEFASTVATAADLLSALRDGAYRGVAL